MKWLAAAACGVSALAQIAGTVRDASTRMPLEGAELFASHKKATTDVLGRFSFEGVEPGRVWISATDSRHCSWGGVSIVVEPGQQLDSVAVDLKSCGGLRGAVRDEAGKPVAGVSVALLGRGYEHGELVYVQRGSTKTGDDGEYSFEAVPPERGYLLLARTPLKLTEPAGKAVFAPTYHPNSQDATGAAVVTLAPGEVRTGIDVRLISTESNCIDGKVSCAPARSVWISERITVEGNAGEAKPGLSGEFRACGLHGGEYRVDAGGGATALSIAGRDVHDLIVPGPAERPARAQIAGKAVWDPAPAGSDKPQTVLIGLKQETRTSEGGRLAAGLFYGDRATVPGPFALGPVRSGAHRATVERLPPGCYLKSAAYGAIDVLSAPVPVKAESPAELRLALACDGGALVARVTDRDGNPVSGVTLYAIPEAATVATLADLLYRSDVDRGTAGIATAPPGKYRVFATAAPVEDTYEWMHRLWDLRSRAKDVVIGPGARVEAQIEAIE